MKTTLRALALVMLTTVALDAFARASDFEVRTLAGETVPLSHYFEPGKWTMVMMWTTYCGTCRAQYPVVSEFHDRHKDKGAKVVGLSLDGWGEAEKVRNYVANGKMSFDSAIADVDRLLTAYLAITEEAFTGTPTYLLFDPSGDLVAHVPGTITVSDVEAFIAEETR